MKHKRAIILLILLSVIVLAAVFLPLEQLLLTSQHWAETNPRTAVFLVGAFFTFGVILLLPATPFLLLSGFLFGAFKGFLVIWAAGIFASTAAFWIGKTIARPWVENKMKGNSTFIAIDRAIERKGFLLVLLTRLVMVLPYTALNYSLGLTKVSLRDYVMGTNIGMIPPFFLVIYLGTTVSDVTAILTGDVELLGNEIMVSLAALAMVIVVFALIIRIALKALREELATTGPQDPTSP